jgi:hypothetical protein
MYQSFDTFFSNPVTEIPSPSTIFAFLVDKLAYYGRFAVFLRKVGQQFAEGVLFFCIPSTLILPQA